MNKSLNIIQANTHQATVAFQKIILRKSSPGEKVEIFPSKNSYLTQKKVLLTQKAVFQNSSKTNCFNFFTEVLFLKHITK